MKRKISDPKIRKRLARRTRVLTKTRASDRTRLTVFRSSRHIYAQLVDPTGRTLTTISTRSKGIVAEGASTGGVVAATWVGGAIAEAAKKLNIEEVVFNRNGFRFHGRVKALAEAAREAGLRF